MSELWSLAYISNAARPLDKDDIDFILADARSFNEEHAITGVLLYDNGIFFQLLEAEKHPLDLVYERIKSAKRHRNLTEFFYHMIDKRRFDQWFMGFSQVPTSVLQQLAQSNWLSEIRSNPEMATPSDGMLLLLDFWQVANQKRPQ